MIDIRHAESSTHIAHARELFQEYAASLNFDLCFQSFDKELADLPGDYAPPSGRLLIAYINDEPAGCIALHAWSEPSDQTMNRVPHGACAERAQRVEREQGERSEAAAKRGTTTGDPTPNICEMKRLYVRPAARGHNLGRQLIDRILAEARAIGYTHMRLDTVPGTMDHAIALYREYGFYEIPPYRPNPQPGVLYFELEL